MKDRIKTYRTEIMGIATIMILLGHSVFYGEGYVHYGILNDFITLGYSGVDIFLFLSGFGLAFSMNRNNKKTFWKHRINRLLPSFVCVWVLFLLVHFKGFSRDTLYAPLLMLYLGGYWYIGFLSIAYLIFPWLYSFSLKKNGYLVFTISIMISLSFLMPFVIKGTAVSCNPLVCIVTRVPIFTLGMLYAIGKFDIINKLYFICAIFVIGLLSLIPYYEAKDLGGNRLFTTYYSILLLTVPVIYAYLKILKSFLWGGHFLRWIGSLSLDVYLVQVTIMPVIMNKLHSMNINSYLNVMISVFIVVVVSFLINRFCNKILMVQI